jgi:DNA-binding response OmpR family regulator
MATKTILIVEDEALLRDELQVYLISRNFRTLLAGNVDEARAIMQRETPDLILLDLLLGGENGIVILESLRDEGSRIPVIVITNTGFASRRKQCMQLGARDFIIKSNTSLHKLVQLIVKHCDAATGGTQAEG